MISAIVAAIAKATEAVSNVIVSSNQRKSAYLNWLSQSVPEYTDIFGNYKTPKDKTNLTIIAILAGLIVLLVITVAIKKNK